MISLRANIQNLIHKGIISAFPINDSPSLKSINSREEIFQSDYICESPKQIFDKYKIKNSFFGLTTYKEVADDIKTQVPRNQIISKIEATQNGGLKIKISDIYLKENLVNYENFFTLPKQKKSLVCLPGLETDEKLEYDYFRGLNVAEKLFRTLKALNYSTSCALPIMDRTKMNKSHLKKFDPLLHNKYFDFNTDICLYSELLTFCNEKFYDMNKEFIAFQRKGEANLSIISLLLYQLKFYSFDEINLIASQSQEVLLKKTIANFKDQHKENFNAFDKINEFYFGGMLLESRGIYTNKKINYETSPAFGDFDQYLKELDPRILESFQEQFKNPDVLSNEIIKGLDISRTSKSTQAIGEGRVDEFLNKTIAMIYNSYLNIKALRNTHDEDIPDIELDDIGRVLALKLLRINEAVEDTMKHGEFEILFQFWFDLAKLWTNLFDSNLFSKVNSKGLLLRNTLIAYEKFFYIFFGLKKFDNIKV